MRYLFLAFLFVFSMPVFSQNFPFSDDGESVLNARTKQVGQFFGRFNAEENERGEELDTDDSQYHSKKLRKEFLKYLFNNRNTSIDSDTKADFIKYILKQKKFLDYYASGWFSEVKTQFVYRGKQVEVSLFLKLQQAGQGYKWVLNKVYFSGFEAMYYNDTSGEAKFLHPLSHELDFMNLKQVFDDKQNIEYYLADNYTPDHLSLFLHEVKSGNFTFQFVKEIKFHFVQIDGWYFELQNFKRSGTNAGWLISNLMKLNESDKNNLLNYIYHE